MYGGGSKGLMGVVSGAALKKGGRVTGVIPYAMVAAGGEKEQTRGEPAYGRGVIPNGQGRESVSR